jgi:PAS domain S-box-containing protein
MEETAPEFAGRVGVFLSDLEGGGSVVKGLVAAGYEASEFSDPRQAEAAKLGECDALILSPSQGAVLRACLASANAKTEETGPEPAIVICCPDGAELNALLPDDPGGNITLLPWPLDLRLLPLQIKALVETSRTRRGLRQRLREREDVLRSISEVFFSVDHKFCYTFFNDQAQKIGGKSELEVLGKDMWDTFPFLKNTEFHRQMLRAAEDRKIHISEYLGPITGGWFEMRIYPSAGGLSALLSISPPAKRPRLP